MIMIRWWYELWYDNEWHDLWSWYGNELLTYDYDMKLITWIIICEMKMNGLIIILYNLWLWYDDGMNYDMIMNGMTYEYNMVMNCCIKYDVLLSSNNGSIANKLHQPEIALWFGMPQNHIFNDFLFWV